MSNAAVRLTADLLVAVHAGDERGADDLLLDHRADVHETAKILAELVLAHVAASGADPGLYAAAMKAGAGALTAAVPR